MPIKIAIQGERASFHNIAAQRLFGTEFELVTCETFEAAFAALAHGRADKIVVALENSLFGSINQTYDLLLRYKFWISSELYLHIKQCLIGLPGVHLSDIHEVHSQLQALAQCEKYLDTHLPLAKRIEQHDTAASVAAIKRWKNPHKAAIASAEAAHLHGLRIIASEIETHKQNYTRFVVLEKKPIKTKAANKTSLVLTTTHKPGALYHAVGVFAAHQMNMTKLQSRPIMDKEGHYMFYLDVSTAAETSEFQSVLLALKKQKCDVTVLGSYKAGKNT